MTHRHFYYIYFSEVVKLRREDKNWDTEGIHFSVRWRAHFENKQAKGTPRLIRRQKPSANLNNRNSQEGKVTILELMKKRRSIRRYKTLPISREVINRVVEAANYAPSGLNRQPWLFVALSNSDSKERIREECEKREERFHKQVKGSFKKSLTFFGLSPVKSFLTEAPYLIVVFAKKNEPYWKESVWISIGYAVLKIEEEGLASLTYTPPQMSFLNGMLNVSKSYEAVAILPVGYADEEVHLGKRKRKSNHQLVKFID